MRRSLLALTGIVTFIVMACGDDASSTASAPTSTDAGAEASALADASDFVDAATALSACGDGTSACTFGSAPTRTTSTATCSFDGGADVPAQGSCPTLSLVGCCVPLGSAVGHATNGICFYDTKVTRTQAQDYCAQQSNTFTTTVPTQP